VIQSRLTTKAQTTIPCAVRQALGVVPGDILAYRIEADTVVLSCAPVEDDRSDLAANYPTSFTEWFDELDAHFDER
jgi:antitoxin PrlF